MVETMIHASVTMIALVWSLMAGLLTPAGAAAQGAHGRVKTMYDFTMKDIDGKEVSLSRYRGKVVLIVNVASFCGYTKQYTGLDSLYRAYAERGLVVLGFPANNFGSQEPGSDEEIKEFCSTKYNVTFPMFSTISVKGDDQHPLYRHLTSAEANPATAGEVRWNFTKYLVDRSGRLVAKFEPRVDPLSADLTEAVEAALGHQSA
jgi:glutathione peroxidase